MTAHAGVTDASIDLAPGGAQITGHPTLEQWGEAFLNALKLGASAAWFRADLLNFVEDEQPFGDDYLAYLNASQCSEGGLRNDRRLGKRFPSDHPLRRFNTELSVSHYRDVASVSDDDAETILLECLPTADRREGRGRDYVRQRVKEIKGIADPQKAALTLLIADDGSVQATVTPPTWAWGKSFEIVIRERSAA